MFFVDALLERLQFGLIYSGTLQLNLHALGLIHNALAQIKIVQGRYAR